MAELALAAYVIVFCRIVGLAMFLPAFGALTRAALAVGSEALLAGAIGGS